MATRKKKTARKKAAKKKTARKTATKKKRAKHRQAKGKAGARRRGKAQIDRPLTVQQEKFSVELAKGNCQQRDAAIRSGYSPRSADAIASQLLDNPKVAARVAELRKQAAKEAGIESQDVHREWGRLGFSDLRDVVEIKGGRLIVRPTKDWSLDAARAVQEISETISKTGELLIKVKMHPKKSALDSIAKSLGVLFKKTEITGKDGKPIKVDAKTKPGLTDEEIEELKKRVLGIE